MRTYAIIFCLGLSSISGAFLAFQARLIPYSGPDAYFRQPNFFPLLTLSAIIILGLVLAWRYSRGAPLPEDDELAGTRPHVRVLLPMAIAFAAYAILTPVLGYLVTTLLFVLGALAIGRNVNLKAVISVIILSAILHQVFVVYLEVWFPVPSALSLFQSAL